MFTRLNERVGSSIVVGFSPEKRCFILINSSFPFSPKDIHTCTKYLNQMETKGYRLLDQKMFKCCVSSISFQFNRVPPGVSPRYMVIWDTYTSFTAAVIPEWGSSSPLICVSLPSLGYIPRCYMVLSKLKTFSEYV